MSTLLVALQNSSHMAMGGCAPWVQREMCPLDQGTVATYFHLQHCIKGFGSLLKDLMGVSLEQVPMEPGE